MLIRPHYHLCSCLFFLLDRLTSHKAATLILLCPLTVTLNALVILVIWKDPFKELRGTANYLILNLAVCDLLIGLPCELLFCLRHWYPNNKVMIVAAYTIMYLAFHASFLTILGLAVERLIVIESPLNSAGYLTSSYLALGVITIWLFAGILAFLVPILEWDSVSSYRTVIVDAFYIPITIVVLACYTRVYFLVRKTLYLNMTTSEERRKEGQALTQSACDLQRLKRKERSVACSVFILILIFIVCWMPLYVIENVNEFCASCNYKVEMWMSLVLLHPLVNPIAYALRTAKFRKALRRVFWRDLRGSCINQNNRVNGSLRRAIV